LSKAITKASTEPNISKGHLQNIMNHFVNAVGGSSTGQSGSSSFGRAGISRAKRFMSFVSNVQSGGFATALNSIGIQDVSKLSINEFINYLLAYCSDGNSNLDETAANSAMNELLKDILNSIENLTDIETIFQNASFETQSEWLCSFFATYIVEFSSELFSTRIFENDGDRVRTFSQIKDYIQHSLAELNLSVGLQNINWNGEQGTVIITNFQKEILEIWSHE